MEPKTNWKLSCPCVRQGVCVLHCWTANLISNRKQEIFRSYRGSFGCILFFGLRLPQTQWNRNEHPSVLYFQRQEYTWRHCFFFPCNVEVLQTIQVSSYLTICLFRPHCYYIYIILFLRTHNLFIQSFDF